MEADSTTHENSNKTQSDDELLPFACSPGILILYKEFISEKGNRNFSSQLVVKLQNLRLIPAQIACPTNGSDCKVVCRAARVIDRVQWVCEGCGKRQPIRTGTFFFKLQCSILQVLEVILAWCEDIDINEAAGYFDVKPRTVTLIYDKLDELAILELRKCKLGGGDSVVLTEMYPDCVNRLSPDTTDQPIGHRILMLTDTNHVPSHYRLHVIKDDLSKKTDSDELLKAEVERILPEMTVPNSTITAGSNVPVVDGMLLVSQHCDADMQHFLSHAVWRQALTLCAATRGASAGEAQNYLDAALYRFRHSRNYYQHILGLIANMHFDT